MTDGKLNQYCLLTYLPACGSILNWFIFLNGQIIYLYFMNSKILCQIDNILI